MRLERRPGSADGGFALLEVLVAFAIAALALAVLFRVGIDGLVAARVAGHMDEALAHARSRLAAACHGARLTPGTTEGKDGSDFAWRTQVQVADSVGISRGSAEDPGPGLRATLYAVQVTIGWGSGANLFGNHRHQVALATSCLGIRQAEPA